MLDSTGGKPLTVSQIVCEAAGNNSAIVATGAGTGYGVKVTGGSSNGHGIYSYGNGTGDGMWISGGPTGDGVTFVGQTGGHGIRAQGGASSGDGFYAAGGATDGHGINAIGGGSGHGVNIDGATLYCKMTPCKVCAMMIINAGIIRVVCDKHYHAEDETIILFKKAGIDLVVMSNQVEEYDRQ